MRNLNKDALKIIRAVQALRTFAMREGEVTGHYKDWKAACQQYYNSIPDQLMYEAGLRKNEHDFWLVLDFHVTEEIIRTAEFLLDKFALDSTR